MYSFTNGRVWKKALRENGTISKKTGQANENYYKLEIATLWRLASWMGELERELGREWCNLKNDWARTDRNTTLRALSVVNISQVRMLSRRESSKRLKVTVFLSNLSSWK